MRGEQKLIKRLNIPGRIYVSGKWRMQGKNAELLGRGGGGEEGVRGRHKAS